jgi:hypothetical protein
VSDLRQRYASTALQGLGSSPERERAVDVVGAAGRANAIGVDIWKTAYSLEASAWIRLRTAAIKAFQERYPRENLVDRVVEQAIHEFCGPACAECTGTGKVGALALDSPQVVCPECNGTKIRHYTDITRAAMMSVSYAKTKHLAHKIGWTIQFLSGLDKDVNSTMNEQLERSLD